MTTYASTWLSEHGLETNRIYDTGLVLIETGDFFSFQVREKKIVEGKSEYTGNMLYPIRDVVFVPRFEGNPYTGVYTRIENTNNLPCKDYVERSISRALEAIAEGSKDKFTTLLKRFYHERTGVNLPSNTVAKIGEIYGKLLEANRVVFEFYTDEIDWAAGSFGNDHSCYWGCYSEAKDTLNDLFEDDRGFAVRFYSRGGPHNYSCKYEGYKDYWGYGRLWAVMYRGFPVFYNPYPAHNNFSAYMAQIESITGLEANPVSLCNNGESYGTLYINDGEGYTLGDDDNRHSIDFRLEITGGETCCECGGHVSEDDARYNDNGDCYCESCYDENYFYCHKCESECSINDRVDIGGSRRVDYVCEDCAHNAGYYECDHCGTWTDSVIETLSGSLYCEDCIDSLGYHPCEHCGIYDDDCTEQDGLYYCEGCQEYIPELDNPETVHEYNHTPHYHNPLQYPLQ